MIRLFSVCKLEQVSSKYTKIKTDSIDLHHYQFSVCPFLWCHRESNQGHTDFQSVALPTELWHQIFGLQIYVSILSKQNLS